MKKKFVSNSAFSNPRVLLGAVLCVTAIGLAFLAFRNASAQGNSQTPQVRGIYQGLSPVVHFDLSPNLRDMTPIPPGPGQLRENEDREIVPLKMHFATEWDPVVQSTTSG